jgi:hypothetical protein
MYSRGEVHEDTTPAFVPNQSFMAPPSPQAKTVGSMFDRLAPEGFQDSEGFHLGKQPPPIV